MTSLVSYGLSVVLEHDWLRPYGSSSDGKKTTTTKNSITYGGRMMNSGAWRGCFQVCFFDSWYLFISLQMTAGWTGCGGEGFLFFNIPLDICRLPFSLISLLFSVYISYQFVRFAAWVFSIDLLWKMTGTFATWVPLRNAAVFLTKMAMFNSHVPFCGMLISRNRGVRLCLKFS